MIRTLSCHCGAMGPDNYFVLNASCIDGIDPHTLTVERYDGLTDMPGGDVPPLADHG
jgi:hypothetical protein